MNFFSNFLVEIYRNTGICNSRSIYDAKALGKQFCKLSVFQCNKNMNANTDDLRAPCFQFSIQVPKIIKGFKTALFNLMSHGEAFYPSEFTISSKSKSTILPAIHDNQQTNGLTIPILPCYIQKINSTDKCNVVSVSVFIESSKWDAMYQLICHWIKKNFKNMIIGEYTVTQEPHTDRPVLLATAKDLHDTNSSGGKTKRGTSVASSTTENTDNSESWLPLLLLDSAEIDKLILENSPKRSQFLFIELRNRYDKEKAETRRNCSPQGRSSNGNEWCCHCKAWNHYCKEWNRYCKKWSHFESRTCQSKEWCNDWSLASRNCQRSFEKATCRGQIAISNWEFEVPSCNIAEICKTIKWHFLLGTACGTSKLVFIQTWRLQQRLL